MVPWVWAGASVRGTSHVKSGTPCQDAFKCNYVNGTLIVLVADGAGSAEFGGQGALLVCRTLAQRAAAHFEKQDSMPDDAALWSWIDDARDLIATAAMRRAATPRAFASTLVCVLAAPTETLIMHIGDGAAALKCVDFEDWMVPLWPAHGEYASTTFFITDDPSPNLRIERRDQPCSAAVVMSDGLERLALSFSSEEPHRPFFDSVVKPLANSQHRGRDATLAGQLRTYLNSAAINERTDDDKTLVVAVRK
jgi:hypothetical protein